MRSSEERYASRDFMREERREIRRLLGQLSPNQWRAASLAGDWSVRDLVAHLVGWDDLLIYRTRCQHVRALIRFFALYAVSLASMDRVNRHLDARYRKLTPDELMDRFGADDTADLKWLFDGTNPGAHLAEYTIHRYDIALPLGLVTDTSASRMIAALNGVTKLPGLRVGARRLLFRRQFRATDLDWSRGRGRTFREPAVDILMVLAGRRPIAQ